MTTGEQAVARQATIGGRFLRGWLRGSALFCWLFIAVIPAMLWTGEIDMPWWGAVLTTVGVGLILLLVGALIWSIAVEARHDTERLKRAGRVAVAEVLSVEVIDPGDGSSDIARMELTISGEGVPSFPAICRMDYDKHAHREGAKFTAIVDPSDNLFTLQQF